MVERLRVIAIDGPAGSGKSTVAKALAVRLGLRYLDTGAMYRAVTFAALRHGLEPDDAAAVVNLATKIDLEVTLEGVRVDGTDCTVEIRGPEVTRAVSEVSAIPGVREELKQRQRDWARRHGGGVIEGRDIGSVVFPDATLKVYLDASPEIRALRRSKEVTDLDYETVAADIIRRDTLDHNTTPLTRAGDAVGVDTSDLSIDEIVELIAAEIDDTANDGVGDRR